MHKIVKSENINKQAWDRLLNESPTASWFQSYNCYQFYKKLDFLKPFAIAVVDQDKILALVCGYIVADGGFLKKFMSRRAIVPGGILIFENANTENVKILLNELKETLSGSAIYTEFRNYYDYSALKEVFAKCGYNYKTHLNFQVQTPSVEDCLKQLSTT